LTLFSSREGTGQNMEHHADYTNFDKVDNHREALELLVASYSALADGNTNWITNLANCSSLLFHLYSERHVNWSGFYITDELKNDELYLGPFMGKVACQVIKIGKGVCGTAASLKTTQLVKNVEEFPGHIACDGDTKSEIVVPIIQDGECVAVMDLDCTELNGFDETDQELLELLATKISESCVF